MTVNRRLLEISEIRESTEIFHQNADLLLTGQPLHKLMAPIGLQCIYMQ